MTGVWVLIGTVVVAGAIAWLLQAREGRIRPSAAAPPSDGLPEPVRAALAAAPSVTLLQVSTTFCAPCRHARTVLRHLADGTDGLTHVELDVTDRPEIATSLGVLRTPTTVAFTSDGTELLRVGGVPRGDTLIEALRPHLR
ncbi:MAG TPA: thioredoxin family protein [Pseudonocardiaceae bacterium]|nr:thioredoxin family protein [Pseudonocardiaceae bacterium]